MMARLGRLSKHLALMVAAQAVCLILGLWLHHRFVVSSAVWEAEAQTWNSLTAVGGEVLTEIRGLRPTDLVPADANDNGLRAQLGTVLAGAPARVLIVDPERRVLLDSLPDNPDAAFSWKRGAPIVWKNSPQVARTVAGPFRGTLTTPGGPRLALALRLVDGQGTAVVYSTQPEVEPSAATILSSLPVAGVIALAWVLGLQSIVSYLVLSRIASEHARKQAKSDEEMLRRTQDLVRTRDAVVFGLAKLAESRDPETGHHLERISLYSTRLASAMRRSPKFRDQISPSFVRLIGISSALHDIGKVGVKDAVLLKPGKLTKEERVHMQSHALIGSDCLRMIEQRLGSSNFLEMAREIALCHHEDWDGTGYPSQLAGNQIPLAARIVAIADVYDALSSRRVYKDPRSHKECLDFIRDQAGSKFDPEMIEVFLKIEGQFRDIARQYSSTPQPVRNRTRPDQLPASPAAATPEPAALPAPSPAPIEPNPPLPQATVVTS